MTSTAAREAATPAPRGGDGGSLATSPWAYFEGALVPFEQATVSIATHALNYGTAIFEGIRAYRQHDGGLAILFAQEHYTRFLRNGRLLRATPPESVADLVDITVELLRRHGTAEDLYIRPLLYKGARSIRLQLSDLEDRISIYAFPLGDYMPTDGLRVSISAWQRVNDNAIPARGKVSGSYVNACMAVEDAHAGGYQESILLGSDGHLSEASAANVFVVDKGILATPPLADDVLPGITRDAVIGMARDAGYTVDVRPIDRTELYLADEVFFTGTGAQVAPVSTIDGRPVGDGSFPIGLDIQHRYAAAVRGQDPRYAHWLTPVSLPSTTHEELAD